MMTIGGGITIRVGEMTPDKIIMKKQIVIAMYREDSSWVPPEWIPITLTYSCLPHQEYSRNRSKLNFSLRKRLETFRLEDYSFVSFQQGGNFSSILETALNLSELYEGLKRIFDSASLETKEEGTVVQTSNNKNGREATQWLNHIIWNYDRLADVTCFLQGYPFDHCSNIIEEVNAVERGSGTFPQVGIGAIGGKDIDMIKGFWQKLMGFPLPETIQWSAGAQFYAEKELFLSKPLKFYEDLQKLVSETPRSGEIMERLWLTILRNEPQAV
jgi:hypothetical protein